MKNKKDQQLPITTIILIILATFILVCFIVFFIERGNSIYTKCLAERLCWDNGYEFDSYFGDKVICYSISNSKDSLQKKFINVNWTALDQKYVCKK